jgi:hypothetical protein
LIVVGGGGKREGKENDTERRIAKRKKNLI